MAIVRGTSTFYVLTVLSGSGWHNVTHRTRAYIVDVTSICPSTNRSHLMVNVTVVGVDNAVVFGAIIADYKTR